MDIERENSLLRKDFFDSFIYSPSLFAHIARSKYVREAVIKILEDYDLDEREKAMLSWFKRGVIYWGESWDYIDSLTVLYSVSEILKPENYLEIGVRRGRSMAVVAKAHPDVNIYGIDLWIPHYAGLENPGPEFVKNNLKLFHRGNLNLISGNSHEEVPKLKKLKIQFDLVFVDGDHSFSGAFRDLINVAPLVKPGGVIVFDDINHPLHPYLLAVWQKFIRKHPEFTDFIYKEQGRGVAIAVKKENKPIDMSILKKLIENFRVNIFLVKDKIFMLILKILIFSSGGITL